MPTEVLMWDDCPPSMNQKSSGYAANHHVAARAKQTWEGILMAMLLKSKLPKRLAWVHVDMELRFPDRRRRDEGNYRMLVEKALGDVMQRFDYIRDDTPDIYRFGSVSFNPEKGPKQMTLRLAYELEGADGF